MLTALTINVNMVSETAAIPATFFIKSFNGLKGFLKKCLVDFLLGFLGLFSKKSFNFSFLIENAWFAKNGSWRE